MDIQSRYEQIINKPFDRVNQNEIIQLIDDIVEELDYLSDDSTSWEIMKQLSYKHYLYVLNSFII